MHDSPPTRRPLTLSLLLVAAGVTIFFRLLPPDVREWNLAPAGAMFLFAGARARSWQLLIPIATQVALDLFFHFQHGWLIPLPSYLAFALYALIGRALIRRSESPVAVLVSAVLGTLGFFFITNTAVWLEMRYDPDTWVNTPFYCEASLNGLLKCYEQALPFSKGTLFGDLIFTPILFAAFAWLSRAYFVEERVAAERAVVELSFED